MRSLRAWSTSPLDALIVTNFTIVGHSEAEKLLFRILCANCVPDSEDTQVEKTTNPTCDRLSGQENSPFGQFSVNEFWPECGLWIFRLCITR